MNPLLAHLKDAWRLSSLAFMLGAFGAGTLLLFARRTSAWGRRWLAGLLLGYWVASLPPGAIALSTPLAWRHDRRLESAAGAAGAGAVVVLGGGTLSHVAGGIALDDLANSGLRIAEGVRAWRLLGDPLLIVSGGNTQQLDPPRTEAGALREAARRLGVPDARIVVEETSLNTREQALRVHEILEARGIARFVLVTSPVHMSRSLAIFRKAGMAPIPSASRLRSEQDDELWTLVPERKALLISDAAIYEYAAWSYYWLRGWV
ncbi:MAG: YdcF family protein [Acidobacteria bacterium]|nr:YdcF family protein [Acidobacteriota bacterium]